MKKRCHAACAVALLAAASAASAQESRPNILLIISDDIGLDVTTGMAPNLLSELEAIYGPQGRNHEAFRSIEGRPASTPVLDELAREGMTFTNVWAQPFCSPTRASILTGLFASKMKVLTYADPLSQNHTSFVQRLKDEGGYSTAVFGKWHMAGLPGNPVDYPGMKPKEAGFDLFKGNMHAAIPSFWRYDYQVQDESTPPGEWRTEQAPVKSLPGIAPTNYAPVVKAADTIEWITQQEAQSPEKPWFVWLAFNLSHATSIQQPSAMAVPNADTLDAVSRKEMEDCGGEFGSNNVGSCSGEALMRAMTNSMDTIIGKVLEAVDEIDSNTYVIYIGDNGTPMYGRPNLDFIDNMYITRTGRGKGTAFESGVRVPLAVRGPRIPAGKTNAEYSHAADLFSTVLALADVDVPEKVADVTGTGTVELDAVSLAPILFGEKERVRDPNEGYLLTETSNLMRDNLRLAAARNASYKVSCTSSVDDCEFFDVAADPLEEYPLEKPASCAQYENGRLTPRDQDWHYCRLLEVLAEESFLASDWVPSPIAAPARGAGPRGRGAGAGAGPRGRGAGPAGRGGARGGALRGGGD